MESDSVAGLLLMLRESANSRVQGYHAYTRVLSDWYTHGKSWTRFSDENDRSYQAKTSGGRQRLNTNRVKKKIPALLIDGDSSQKANDNKFMRLRYGFTQFQKRNPQRCSDLTNKLIKVLKEIDEEIKETVSESKSL